MIQKISDLEIGKIYLMKGVHAFLICALELKDPADDLKNCAIGLNLSVRGHIFCAQIIEAHELPFLDLAGDQNYSSAIKLK